MANRPKAAAIIVAAGRGLRAGAGGPKQYRSIAGRTVIARATEPFCRHPGIWAVQPVRNPDDAEIFDQALQGLHYRPAVSGGATRQASVCAGLEALAADPPEIVLIHDAARAFVTEAVIARAIDAAGKTGAAIPVVAVIDTIKQVDDSGDVDATPDRARLRIAQTPQAFRFDVILDAHRRAAREGRDDFTDDAALAEWAGLTVATFEGDAANMKLTTPEDFAREEARLGAALGDIRTGTGYDVHAFGDGDHVMLCGVKHALQPRLPGPFRRRRRVARAGRCHSRRIGRRRHRIALSAERSAVEGRRIRQIPDLCDGTRRRPRRPRGAP